ncbi:MULTISPECIES: hypothetical protein [unclassified Sphingopyxis]|uniref:hypothetical protein n=1 Tax=unclassified Sphingopyxis TaxID=2614943 RepID=UPI00285F8DC9|nr:MULTISPECIES: hypothetical protein [unclassified Sphingopyxis]MDR7061218.1 DNA polymerase elongation subunit (family B) [Sphingopyxis sp. BE235]MDR7182051.1 DNA polymerase elongation subunit (family B) [Sphingopyxis sp. BE249]
MKRTLANDIEVYENYFLVAFMDIATGQILTFERFQEHPGGPVEGNWDPDRIQTILRSCQIVTFNGKTYDVPLIFLALAGTPLADLKASSNRIINQNLKWWDAGRELGVYIPDWLDHIDLIEPNPAVMQGLKVLNGRLHGPRMQDLPYPHEKWLTREEADNVRDYCGNDLDATGNQLFKALEEPLQMRIDVANRYGLDDIRSKSDAQIGEAIIKKRVEQITGLRPKRDPVAPGTQFQYEVPDFIRFETPEMNALLDEVRATTFRVKSDGRVDLPKSLNGRYVKLGDTTYKMGIGGLHSTEANRAVHADANHLLIDADVASQYPSIILKLGLYPKALGPAFLEAYRQIYDERLGAKARAKVIEKVELPAAFGDRIAALKAELLACTVVDKGLKIALNGCYGKLGSKWSVLHAPHLLIAVTLTGQLSLLMLAERAELAGIGVVSGNTDGLLFRCPKHLKSTLDAICEQWERETSFVLEYAEYQAIYNLSVNTYYAIKSDGSVKRKGTLSNPWAEGDLRGQMMKNPNMTICSDAALRWITDGVDPGETIRESRDIRGFVTVVNVAGGGKWREEPIGKVVRYAWCRGGEPIFYKTPHETTGNFKKVSRTDGSRPIMNLPSEFPDNIDYDRYIEEAWDILRQVGAIAANDNDPGPMLRAEAASL